MRAESTRLTTSLPRLEVRGLGKQFGGVRALHEIDLALEPGEVLGLIGSNGSGKTTVVNCVSGVLKPTSGVVLFGPDVINHWSRPRRAKAGIVRTYQNLRLFSGLTVAENIEVGIRPGTGLGTVQRRKRVAEVLEEQSLAGLERELVGSLSYGQQRQVEVARALAAEPRVLLLDEPAAGLTDEETILLRDVLERAQKEREFGILIIDHDVSLIMSISDRVVVLHEGQVICEGSPSDVCRDPRVTSVFLGSTGGANA